MEFYTEMDHKHVWKRCLTDTGHVNNYEYKHGSRATL